tara:strand:+ start:484 stop:708 length:225 start_codon:yes stop_codon:yes gene_type:complete
MKANNKLIAEFIGFELDTTNGHDKSIVDRFNIVAKQYGEELILEHILVNWVDDADLLDITETLENRLLENDIKF